MRHRLAAIAATITLAAAAAAQTSEYFVMAGDQNTFHVLQNGMLIRSWSVAAGTDDYQYPLAVAGTVRAMGADDLDIGAEYDLDGNDLGTRYTHPAGAVNRCWDGTTDGLHNYAIDSSGNVWQFDRDWQNATALFDAGSIGAITYDPSNQTLWVSQFSSQVIREYDLAGNVVSSFSTGHTQNMALALDHADDTLWLHDRNVQGSFEQWTKTGTLLQRVPIPGMSTENALAGEMAFPGGASCTFRNGSGSNAADFACATLPILGSTWTTSFGGGANTLATLLAVGTAPSLIPGVFGGEVLIAVAPTPITIAGTADILVPMPSNPATVGTQLSAQGFRLDFVGAALLIVPLNAQDVVIGY